MKQIEFFTAPTLDALQTLVDTFISQNPNYIPDSSSLAWDGSAWAMTLIFLVIT